MERFGLVGLPNSGKTSLFNALTGATAYAAPYAFATKGTNVGVAKVPDDRLDRLAAMSESRKVVAATVQFTDIGGLVAGSSRGEGLGNAFLGHIRDIDAIVYVLAAFEPEPAGATNMGCGTDPAEQLGLLELELALADLDSATRQHEKLVRAAKGDPTQRDHAEVLAEAIALLSDGIPLYRAGLEASRRQELRRFFLLTNKPVMAVVNIGEAAIGEAGIGGAGIGGATIDGAAAAAAPVQAELGDDAEVITLCVQLEAEAAQLDAEDRSEMLDALGLGDGALARFLGASYHLMGLRTFLTTSEKESRAWTFRAGATAAECAGVIHSDIQRGFIRADTIAWQQLLEAGSWNAAHRQGLVRSEGRAYPVSDGDVMLFKFNV